MILDETLKQKYIGVKPRGFKHYVWFDTEKVIEDLGCFIGQNGWGRDGAFTNLKCKTSEIASVIHSDTLQY